MRVQRFAAVSVGLLVGLALSGCEPRADLVVTKPTDTNDGRCNADCSLREAVVAANAAPGRDVIRVPSQTYGLTRRGKGEDASATGDLDITGDLLIEASGGSFAPTIDGQVTGDYTIDDRVLDVHAGTVEVRGIHLTNGKADNGGVVRSNASLTLVDLSVSRGYAWASGGGILSGTFSQTNVSLTLVRTTVGSNRNTEEGAGIRSTGRLRIADSVIEDNSGGPAYGMGLDTRGDAEIRDSVIRDNGSITGGAELCGGGIRNTGTLVIRDTRISNNGGESGGGILNSSTGALTVVNSQIRYNRAKGSGGGVANAGGRVLLDATTVAGNESDWDAPDEDYDCPPGAPGEGGGLYNSADGSFALRNTVVAFNDDGAGTGGTPDCSGTFIDRGGNTIGDRRGCVLTPA
ncbi:MAG: CSLREA domain-containing protein [Actinomycetota bacterium]|nr:CSLREA domain-containing protein [Actinomycetota bacterium]